MSDGAPMPAPNITTLRLALGTRCVQRANEQWDVSEKAPVPTPHISTLTLSPVSQYVEGRVWSVSAKVATIVRIDGGLWMLGLSWEPYCGSHPLDAPQPHTYEP